MQGGIWGESRDCEHEGRIPKHVSTVIQFHTTSEVDNSPHQTYCPSHYSLCGQPARTSYTDCPMKTSFIHTRPKSPLHPSHPSPLLYPLLPCPAQLYPSTSHVWYHILSYPALPCTETRTPPLFVPIRKKTVTLFAPTTHFRLLSLIALPDPRLSPLLSPHSSPFLSLPSPPSI